MATDTITQFRAIKADFDALAAKFDALMATIEPAPAPAPVSTIEEAKAKARADLEARIKARVAELTAKTTIAKKAPYNGWYQSQWRSSGQQYLDQVHAMQAQKEYERKVRRDLMKQARPSKFQLICNEVRKQFPNMPQAEVYIAARMRLKLKQHVVKCLAEPTPFERACADAKKLQPDLEGAELFAAARRLIEARRVIPVSA